MSKNATTAARKSTASKKAATAPVQPEQKDWTYLLEKDPSTLHTTFAEWISAELGVEFDPKHVQVVLGMHGAFQKGERNKARPDYKPLDSTIVAKRSEHMTLAHTEAREARAQAQAAEQAKKDAAAAKRKAAAEARKAAKAAKADA